MTARSLTRALRAYVPHRRMGLITVDQCISGGSNLLIILLVAHLLTPAGFGWFTIAFLIYTLAATVQRALIAGPVMVHPEDADERPGEVLGAALTVALAMSVLCGAAGALMWDHASGIGKSLVILAVLLPLLMLQDLGRYLSWAAAKPERSIWLDLTWLLLLIAGFSTLMVASVEPSVVVCILAWAGSGAAAGTLVVLRQYRLRVRDVNPGWLRRRWSFSWKYLVGAVAAQVSVLGAVTIVAALSTAGAVAAVRAVTLLTRPGYAVQVAIAQSVATEIARDKPAPKGVWVHVLRAVVITSIVAVANVGALLLLPGSVGRAILGDIWPLAAPLILPAGLQLLLAGLGSGTRDALLGLRQINLVTTLDLVGAMLLVTAAGIGAAVADAEGVLWALVVTQAVLSAGWWLSFVHRLGRYGVTPPESAAVGVSADRGA